MKKLRYYWEHNGDDSIVWAADYPGVATRGDCLQTATGKLPAEVCAYLRWAQGVSFNPADFCVEVAGDYSCALNVRDADSDMLLDTERGALDLAEYAELKALALKSARDFYRLYLAVPDKTASDMAARHTFYGELPRTAEQMYIHTKNVNAYYFGEIGIDADNDGDIFSCRARGFDALEKSPDFLQNAVWGGAGDELWSLKKLLRRFIWHDRIHARAMFKMARRVFGDCIPDIFKFGEK